MNLTSLVALILACQNVQRPKLRRHRRYFTQFQTPHNSFDQFDWGQTWDYININSTSFDGSNEV